VKAAETSSSRRPQARPITRACIAMHINFLVPSLYQLIQISLHSLAFFSRSSGQPVDYSRSLT
jgi:hypothetical protein